MRASGALDVHPTFFEVTTAVAFELFRRAGVTIEEMSLIEEQWRFKIRESAQRALGFLCGSNHVLELQSDTGIEQMCQHSFAREHRLIEEVRRALAELPRLSIALLSKQ